MPKVHQQVAREARNARNCQRCGEEIKSGQRYFWAKGRNQPKKIWCKLHPPKPSELTGSEKLAMVYGAQEQVDQALTDWDAGGSTVDDLVSALQEAAGQAREAAEGYEESLGNMPEGLQQGPTGQDIEEKAGACNDWADELESAADDLFDFDEEDARFTAHDAHDCDSFKDSDAHAKDTEEAVDDMRNDWESEQRDLVENAKDALSL